MTTRTLKTSWALEAPQLLLLLAMFALAIGTWDAAPDQIPMHWDERGQVDRFGGKAEGLFLLPLVALGTYLLLRFLPRVDPGRANYANFAGAYAVIRFSVLALLAAVYGWVHLTLRGRAALEATVVAPFLAGLLFLVLGGVLGKVRPNWFVGVRTPWTLSSKQAWMRTHRLAGWLFLFSGLTLWALLLVSPLWAARAIPVAALLSAGVAAVYSYFVWRADPDKQAPLQTRPLDER